MNDFPTRISAGYYVAVLPVVEDSLCRRLSIFSGADWPKSFVVVIYS